MEKEFWVNKWENNDIGFHRSEANPALTQHFAKLGLPKGNRVFVPLCGKTVDIGWLLAEGYAVAGAELVETAVQQLFAGLRLEPKISEVGQLKQCSADNIDIFVGSIFDLSMAMLGPIDAIYDRAALVALPEAMRRQYAAHLMSITAKAPQLLVTFEYDQTVVDGPPFSISSAELEEHYGDRYGRSLCSSTALEGGLKGSCAATENVWMLRGR